MPNPAESLGYIKCHSSSSPRPIKNPRNFIRTTVQRSAFDSDLKFENTGNQKKGHNSLGGQKAYYSQRLYLLEKKDSF